MRPYTPATYVGNGVAKQLSEILGVDQCKWFTVQPISGGALNGRVGDSTVSSIGAIGFPIGVDLDAEPGFSAPPIAFTMEFYDLTKWYIVLSNGDTAAIGCGV